MSQSILRWTTLYTLFCTQVSPTGALNSSAFQSYQPAFAALIGESPSIVELVTSDLQLFHEAGVYHAPTKALWVASDLITNFSNRFILRVTGLDSPSSTHFEYINHTIPNPVGAYRYVTGTPLGDIILFVAQGTMAKTPPGGIYALNPFPPYNSSLLLGSYGDYPFNSPDDVTVSPDGTIWMTDPVYGFGQGSRPVPLLPNQVYLFNPSTNDVRVVADGFGRPNGVKASPDGGTIYIGDTGAQVGNGTLDFQGPRTIYAFDRVGKFLSNRRIFAMPQALASAPDGIKVDIHGNVWAAVFGKGVYVWDAEGTLLGTVALPGTVGNLGFGESGELFVLGGDRIYKLRVSDSVAGA
ncbi:hypothetical protein LTR15_005558 [Elasticomyces elasticus]|nr:hypothetical protein LTR15_005558 [Elasticomyces elasticus]